MSTLYGVRLETELMPTSLLSENALLLAKSLAESPRDETLRRALADAMREDGCEIAADFTLWEGEMLKVAGAFVTATNEWAEMTGKILRELFLESFP